MMERYLTLYNIHPDSPKRKIYNPVSVWDIGDSLNTINVLETNRKHEKKWWILKGTAIKIRFKSRMSCIWACFGSCSQCTDIINKFIIILGRYDVNQ